MSRRLSAVDRISVDSRTVTPEGFVVVRGAIARTGVQIYRAVELGLDGDPMRVIRLHRPADEVFAPASMATFEGAPLTNDHPADGVTADNWRQVVVGDVRQVARDGDLMRATLTVRDASAIAALNAGRVQISNGYFFDPDMTPGVADGQPYDGVQRNIRGNHVALVDEARCGPVCRISDSPTNQGLTMADAKRKVTVDGFTLEVDDTAANAIDTLVKQRDEARSALEKAKTPVTAKVGDAELGVEALAKLVADQRAQIEQLQKDVMTPQQRDAMVADWAKTIADAKRLVPDLVTDGKTCLQIRREAVKAAQAADAVAKAIGDAVLGGRDVDAAEEPLVRAAFQAIGAAVKPASKAAADAAAHDAAVARALAGAQDGGNGGGAAAELTGRDAHLERLRKLSEGA